MIEYPIGTIIKSRKVNYRAPRIAAVTLLSFAIALGFARTGTTITIHSMVAGGTIRGGVGGSSHTGNVHGGGGGGGTIKIGS